MVSRPDRRDLLLYLDGEVESTPSIDKNAPLEITIQRPSPYVKQSSSSAAQSQLASSTTAASSLSSSSASNVTAAATAAAAAAAAASLKRPLPSVQQLHESNNEMQVDQETGAKIARVGDESGEPMDSANSLIGVLKF